MTKTRCGTGWRLGFMGLCLAAVASPAVFANEFGGQNAYRLSDPNQRAVKLQTLDLRERRQGGAFEFNTTNNIDRQINCNFTVSATGNAASPLNSASGISPVGLQGSGLNASTTGNQSQADNSASGVSSSVSGSGLPLVGGGVGPQVNPGNSIVLDGNSQQASGSHAANGTNVNQVGQSNAGSTLTSGISNSPTTVTIGDTDASGAEILNSVDTSQSISGTDIAANVDGSRACDFVEAN